MRWLDDRRLRRVQQRLGRLRQELAAAEAEATVLGEQSDEDELRSMVSDNGLDRLDAGESGKHAAGARRHVAQLRDRIAALERELDALLDRRLGG